MWNNRAYVENRRYSYGYYFKSKMEYLPLRLLCSLGLGVSVKLSDYLKLFVHTSGQSSEQSGSVEHRVKLTALLCLWVVPFMGDTDALVVAGRYPSLTAVGIMETILLQKRKPYVTHKPIYTTCTF